MTYIETIEPIELHHRMMVLMKIVREHGVADNIKSVWLGQMTYAVITIESFNWSLSNRPDVDVKVHKLSKTSATHVAQWNIDGVQYEISALEEIQS